MTLSFLDRVAEERILEAQREGVFDNLPGKGKPLNLDDDSLVPEDLRLTFKILKNAKCLPPELEVRAEVYNLRQLLNAAVDEESRRALARDLHYRMLKLEMLREKP